MTSPQFVYLTLFILLEICNQYNKKSAHYAQNSINIYYVLLPISLRNFTQAAKNSCNTVRNAAKCINTFYWKRPYIFPIRHCRTQLFSPVLLPIKPHATIFPI